MASEPYIESRVFSVSVYAKLSSSIIHACRNNWDLENVLVSGSCSAARQASKWHFHANERILFCVLYTLISLLCELLALSTHPNWLIHFSSFLCVWAGSYCQYLKPYSGQMFALAETITLIYLLFLPSPQPRAFVCVCVCFWASLHFYYTRESACVHGVPWVWLSVLISLSVCSTCVCLKCMHVCELHDSNLLLPWWPLHPSGCRYVWTSCQHSSLTQQNMPLNPLLCSACRTSLLWTW